MANAIVGTLMLTGWRPPWRCRSAFISGVYLSEYRGSRFASAVRFAADTLNGVPSIVVGVFRLRGRGAAARPLQHAGRRLALGVMMIPIIARTTEELLLLVPNTLREGALALGATRGGGGLRSSPYRARPRCQGSSPGSVLALARIAAKRRRCSARPSTTRFSPHR
jgi:phosphate transport system permease protein